MSMRQALQTPSEAISHDEEFSDISHFAAETCRYSMDAESRKQNA